MNLASARFELGVAELWQLPADRGREVAFAGRSNAGKSSAINALTRRRKLAFVSKTPGRTQQINFFALGERRYLVDLPGYGYAKVSQAVRDKWNRILGQYLATRASLCALVLIMDIRHPLTPLDRQMLKWFGSQRPVLALLTKADKLSRQQALRQLDQVRGEVARDCPGCEVQLFSSVSGLGVEEASAFVARMLSDGDPASAYNPPEAAMAPVSQKKNPRLKGKSRGSKPQLD